MKKLLLLIFLAFIITTANAQMRDEGGNKTFFISAGPELGIPSNSPFTISYGGTLKAEVRILRSVGITLTSGYEAYNYREAFLNFSQQSNNLHPAFIPLKAGIKYYAGPGLYAEGELGSAIDDGAGTGNQFIYALGIGFDVPINNISSIDFGFRYEGYTERQFQVTGIRVAYKLGW